MRRIYTPEPGSKLGQWLAAVRAVKGQDVTQAARESGCNRAQWSRWEAGVFRQPNPRNMDRILAWAGTDGGGVTVETLEEWSQMPPVEGALRATVDAIASAGGDL